ncbi:hypothetical protein B0H19DRAFT_48640 [Mycena capillaripes]|nr:hypothetical protein B0H19DRAFT_48640 [Mycena capillaripes]
MALPAEVAELIIDRCEHKPTLSSCSLVCKAWHARARFHLFSAPIKVVDVPGVPRVKAFVATLRHPLCTIHPYIHSLSIRQPSSNASLLNPVIPVLVELSNLTYLEIVAENALLSDESQALFRAHFMSVRHLLLRMTFATCADAVALVCSFPLLETLRLHARWIGSSPPPAVSLPPNLHALDLDGLLDDILAWLLSCPPSPILSSVQLRDVASRELGIVLKYVRFVAATLKTLKLSFIDTRSETNFLESNFDTIHTPALRRMDVEGRQSNDVNLVVHLLSHLHSSRLEEISFTCLIAVNHRRPAWAQLDQRLSSPAHALLRKVTITTLPHLKSSVQARLPRLNELHLLDFIFPEGL